MKELMKLTDCENDQLVEATRLWFARSGGVVEVSIKKVAQQHSHEHHDDIMPPGFGRVKILPEVKQWK